MAKSGPQKRSLAQVRAEYDQKLMSIDGVVGVGEGEDDRGPFIKVYVARKTSSLMRQIPSQINGYGVDVEVTGEFDAL
ncbi:MAG: hypothetical protein HY763_10215 [Planctomycetes bacterium]|nr:hypothetical protein [Planctomycetota bacterium]